MCDKYELKFNELKASVMNEHRTTENDELFAQVPDEDKYGMIALLPAKRFDLFVINICLILLARHIIYVNSCLL
jgi:hypothetical protein